MLKNFGYILAILTHSLFTCRYDLDACDIQEKYPDLFQVNLEVEVEPRDRPSRDVPPWENTSLRGLNPKILFSNREEQQDILSKFGKMCSGSQCTCLELSSSSFHFWVRFIGTELCLRLGNTSALGFGHSTCSVLISRNSLVGNDTALEPEQGKTWHYDPEALSWVSKPHETLGLLTWAQQGSLFSLLCQSIC